MSIEKLRALSLGPAELRESLGHAVCSFCRRTLAIVRGGFVRQHRAGRGACPGAGKKPGGTT